MGLEIYGSFSSKKTAENLSLISGENRKSLVEIKSKPLLSFRSSDSAELKVSAENSGKSKSPEYKGSVVSDNTKASEWMKKWFNDRDKVLSDAGAEMNTGNSDWYIQEFTNKTVSYTNGSRYGYGDEDVVTKRDSKGRPTQVKHSSTRSGDSSPYREIVTDIIYNKDGGRTEKTKGTERDALIGESTSELVYDKNGKLISGKIISKYSDIEFNRKANFVGDYTVRTYKNGKWYVQRFDKNGKAKGEEITVEEEKKQIEENMKNFIKV